MVSAFELRIALAILAAVIIAAIYVWYRANSKDRQIDELSENDIDLTDELDDIPSLSQVDETLGLPDDLRSEFQDVSKELREETISKRVQEAQRARMEATRRTTSVEQAASDKTSKEMLVIFHVVARAGEVFTGPMIVRMMSDLDLEYGEMGIFHYNVERLSKKLSVYCVANMLKPGVFDMQEMDAFETRGLTMILQLPGPEDELKSFNIMAEHAQRLAAFLNGDLLDENHNLITKQSISVYKEQVQLFGLRATKQSVTA
ncbi:MAG: cell division protein ZipA [Gammaproteobacteria bacterium]